MVTAFALSLFLGLPPQQNSLWCVSLGSISFFRSFFNGYCSLCAFLVLRACFILGFSRAHSMPCTHTQHTHAQREQRPRHIYSHSTYRYIYILYVILIFYFVYYMYYTLGSSSDVFDNNNTAWFGAVCNPFGVYTSALRWGVGLAWEGVKHFTQYFTQKCLE